MTLENGYLEAFYDLAGVHYDMGLWYNVMVKAVQVSESVLTLPM